MSKPPFSRPWCLVWLVMLLCGLVSSCTTTVITSSDEPAALGTINQINPHPRSALQPGGDLRLPLSQFPPNFNPLHIDGNLAENATLLKATMPRAFMIGPDGSAHVDHNYFTSIELINTHPQTVVYTINPQARWSDGTPLTWQDIASQIHATSGHDSHFAIALTNGADRVQSVKPGINERQAVITFARPYAEWKGMFAGNSMLLPASMTATADLFNTAQRDHPGPSAGPFIVTTLDRGQQRIILRPNPRWWGEPPILNSITYLVLDDAARIPALQNHSIDATSLANLDQLTLAQRTAGIAIRHAPMASWIHFTFNGAPGAILEDPRLRVAIMRGIDRETIARVTQYGLSSHPHPLGNHIYVAGQQGYHDNGTLIPYDPARAARELEELGWHLVDGHRSKNGHRLVIRHLFYDAATSRQFALIAQHSLAQLGVTLQLEAKTGNNFFSNYINVGNFDIAQFGWVGDAFPLAGLTQIYASQGEANFGKITNSHIDELIDQALACLDPRKAQQVANQIDQLLWEEGFSLPLTQAPGNVAVRDNLANYGAPGLADLDYTLIGFVKSTS